MRSGQGPILVLDDLEEDRVLARLILEYRGYEVALAASVDEALGMLSRVRPRAVLTDLHMPRRSGFELIDALRSRPETAGLPVLVYSAFDDLHAQRLRELDVAVLRKPIPVAEFLEIVESAVGAPSAEA
ncbi:MAG: response regulator [Gemmatimonadetes bacterium]|nr:response regulator [Gemmatimonadota bacterium]